MISNDVPAISFSNPSIVVFVCFIEISSSMQSSLLLHDRHYYCRSNMQLLQEPSKTVQSYKGKSEKGFSFLELYATYSQTNLRFVLFQNIEFPFFLLMNIIQPFRSDTCFNL